MKHVTNLAAQKAQQSSKLVGRANLKPRDRDRIANKFILLKEGYKERCTDEVFKFSKFNIFNSVTSTLAYCVGEDLRGNFYGPQMKKTW